MNAINPVVTDAGRDLVLRSLCGERITFTRFAAGSGQLPDGEEERNVAALIDERWTFDIKSIDTSMSGRVQLTGQFDSSAITGTVRWTELGVYAVGESRALFSGDGSKTEYTITAKPPRINQVQVGGCDAEVVYYNASTGEIKLQTAPASGLNNVVVFYPDTKETLYAYGNAGDNYSTMSGNSASSVTSQMITIILAVGRTDHVTAIIGENAIYTTKTEFEKHLTDFSNPHHVTADDVGLGNVENKALTDQTPDFTINQSDATLVKGETFGRMLDKIAKIIDTSIKHFTDKENPHNITASMLGVPGIEYGTYFGDEGTRRLIELGYRPKCVIIKTSYAGDDWVDEYGDWIHPRDGMMLDGKPIWSSLSYATNRDKSDASFYEWTTGMAGLIVDNGFIVSYERYSSTGIHANTNARIRYYYIAFR